MKPIDRLSYTVDFLLTAKRDCAAARRFFERTIGLHDIPEKITIDKSGANTAAVHSMIADSGIDVELRQSKYLNNLVEQGHRAIKRRTRPMLGFKKFHTATKLIAGIETMHMTKRGSPIAPRAKLRPLLTNSIAWLSNPPTKPTFQLNSSPLLRQNPLSLVQELWR